MSETTCPARVPAPAVPSVTTLLRQRVSARRRLLPARTIPYSAAALLFLLFLGSVSPARTLHVGSARQYTLPSQAAAAAMDGDTILIDAGEYTDAARWRANGLLIRGTGGYAHVRDRTYGGKAIWVIQGNDTVVEGIEFSGARVPDKNGAGIRQEGTNLTLRHCWFHHNEMGILTNNDANSHIVIEFCHFEHNGYGDGYSHNMYINHVGRFTLRFSYSHDAVIGHNVKSRAHENYILHNRFDEADGGNTSREIDLPNGGVAVIVGNILDHGPNTDNSNLIGFGMEGFSNPRAVIVVANNTCLTARGAGGFVTLPQSGTDTVRIVSNIFAGRATMLTGGAAVVDTAANLVVRDIGDAGFRDPAAGDYHLLAISPAVDAGIPPGHFDGFDLLPDSEYLHPADRRPRPVHPPLDCGAFEFEAPAAASPLPFVTDILSIEGVRPQPAHASAVVTVTLARASVLHVSVHALDGRRVFDAPAPLTAPGRHDLRLDLPSLPAGMYLCRVRAGAAMRIVPLLIVR